MNIDNAQTIAIKTVAGNTIFAERINGETWEVYGSLIGRKDRIQQSRLLRWLASDSIAKWEITKTMPDTIKLRVNVDTAELDALQEKLMSLFVTAGLLRSMGIDLQPVQGAAVSDTIQGEGVTSEDQAIRQAWGVDLGAAEGDRSSSTVWSLDKNGNFFAEGLTIKLQEGKPYLAGVNLSAGYRQTLMVTNPDSNIIEAAKTVTIIGENKVFHRKTLSSMWDQGDYCMMTNATVQEECRAKRASIEMFPEQEYHDWLAVKYGDVVRNLLQVAQEVPTAEAELQKLRDRYSTLEAKRAALYEKMKRLG